ncbi:MAG: 16S rRNA (cytosine(967)-C(5))-methyltransferase RsmB [Pseudomonadota bacterium]
MSKSGARLRAASARAVDDVVSRGRSLDAALAAHDVDDRDRSLYRMLAFGTIRQHFRLRDRQNSLLDKPLRKRDSLVAALIDVGLFQLAETRVPDHAAVSETVAAVRAIGQPKYAGLVNAVLRRAGRETPSPSSDAARRNHPDWIVDTLKKDWPDDWQAMLAANDERAPMWLRVNAKRGDPSTYREQLMAAGLSASMHPALSEGLKLDEPVSVTELPGFETGEVSVQDGGAQLAAAMLPSENGGNYLDACAAPGGKAAHWLELSGNETALTCLELDKDRAGVISDTLDRLRLEATVTVADASKPGEWWNGEAFDAILLDAPCSASGVIRRHPDIKLLRRPTDIAALQETQGRLLDALWTTLKPGGQLLYVTCSVFRDENEAVVGSFLERTGDASEIDVLQNNNIRALMRRKTWGYQLLPGTDGFDGFYFACLAKAT